MKILFGCIFVLCIGLQPVKAQSIYFDNRYDTLGLVEHIKKTFPESYGYSFFNCGNEYVNTPRSTMCLRKVNFEGESIADEKCYYIDSLFFFNTWAEKDSIGNYYLFGNVSDLRDNYSTTGMGLYKFDSSGNLLFNKHIYNDSMSYYAGMLFFTESAFFLLGQIHYPNITGDMFFEKLDLEGNVLFEKRYGGSEYEGGKSLVQTPDSGFLLLGWTRSFGNGQRDWYLVKTDSLGNQEWQKTYGTSANEVGWGIVALHDGNYLIGGGGANPGVNGWAQLKKIDPFGVIIWQKQYVFPQETACSFYWPKELLDGSLVVVGASYNAIDGDAGYLLKTDSMGNEIWQQKYNVSTYPDLFYDVLPTADGGFLLSGMCHPNTQDGWLLKVDSLGCPYPNCTVGIEEETKAVAFNLWPNPAVNELHIELPGSVSSNFVLRDAIGRSIFQKAFNEKEYTFYLSTIPAGIYTAEIDIGKEKYFKKLMIAKE
jgi:hypothetical protein